MINLLTPPRFDDEEKTLVAHHLFIILWTLMAVGWLAIFIAAIIPETVYRWLLVVGVTEMSGLSLLALNQYGHTRLASHLMMIVIWALATGMALTGGGISSNGMALYLVIVLVAGLLQSGKAAMVTAALCSLTGLSLVYLEYRGALPANQVPHTPLTLWISNTVYMFIIICLQYLVNSTIRKALKQSREEVNERQRVEEALRESEGRFRSMIQSLSDMIFVLDGNGNLTYESPSVSRILGYPPGYFIGKSPLTHMHPDDRNQVVKDLDDVFRSVNPGIPTEFRYRKADGTWVYLEALGSNQLENQGIGGIVLTVRDITERKRADEALRKSDERFRAIFNSTFQFTGLLTPEGMLIEANQAALDFAGISMKDVVNQPFWEARWWRGDETRMRQLREAITRANRGEFVRYEVELQGAGDTKEMIDFSLKPVFDTTGKVTLLIPEGRNITDRKRAEENKCRLEERLSRAEKMEALGQLAGGVAHDLNNVLGILSGYSELLLQEIPEGQRSRGHIEKILQSTEKGAAIIQDLLTLARRGVTGSDVIDLNLVVSGFLKTPVFEKMKDHHPRVTFRINCDQDLLNIKGSSLHLEKTLMNLVSNAAESITGAGEVTIRTENRYLDKAIGGYDEVREGDYAVLTVSDTGAGIPVESIGKIFEPFYTKKKMGRSGTGLGLAIVWGTVKDHSGYIDVKTEIGKGTAFTLYFPVTREELIAPQPKGPIERYRGNGESVLVVDDVAEQRDIAAQLLTRLGYRVHRVSGGEEAVEYLKGNSADILVLDMIMAPGIDGLETYRRVLEISPRQKAIIVSGFSETDRVKAAQELGAGAYVKKPYTMEKIGEAIRVELIR